MGLEREQQELLARMVEGARDVPRSDRQWLLMSLGGTAFHEGPGIGREAIPEGDVRMLEREGLIHAIRYSKRDANPTYVLTPEAHDYYAETRGREPAARQESELPALSRFRDVQRGVPKGVCEMGRGRRVAVASGFRTGAYECGLRVREALEEFATETVERYRPAEVETNPALVNKRLGAVIAKLLPVVQGKRAVLLRALGDYSEATLGVVQRQVHGGQKEGDHLTWLDARRVVFHAGSVMYEFAELFRQAASEA